MKYIVTLLMCCSVICVLDGAPVHSENIEIDTSSPFIYPEYSKTISMDFQDAPLVDVLKIFSKQSQLNLVASQEISRKTVTVYLEKVPIEQALEQILRANDLTYEIQPGSNIYIVKPIKKPEVELVTRIYQLKNAAVASSPINTLLNISTESGGGGEESSSADSGITEAVKKVLTKDGKISEDSRTNSLIITDIAANFPVIEQTIARLDINVPQVLIEVEMIEVAKAITDKLGIKWGDTPLILSGGSYQNAFPWDGSFPLLDELPNVDYEEARLTTGLMDARGFTATLNFLRTQGDTKNLARPRILTLNNQTAQIKISTNEAIGEKTTSTGSSDSTTTQTVEAERAETGVILTVTPQANLDTREITMALVPSHTLAKSGLTIGGTTFKDPETRTASAVLKVMDGSTIVIGGLLREETTTTLTKVPLLGDIPVLGAAFRHKQVISQERELLIFITPHIVDNTSTMKNNVTKKLIREQDLPDK